MTLLEVVAAIAILGGLLVGLVLARARHLRQASAASELADAVRLADDLIASWWASPQGVPIGMTGALGGDGRWTWRTQAVSNREIETLGARVVRLEVRGRRAPAGRMAEAGGMFVVDLVLPGDGRGGEP